MPEQTLRNFLRQHLATAPEVQRLVLGFSGGLDSTVLLHALLKVAPEFPLSVRAVHVHHGLSPNADAWAEQVAALCEQHSVPLEIHRVKVENGASLEAAARAARYAVFATSLQAGEALVLAQHRDDQAETLLFRLLRGAGIRGLAAMRSSRYLQLASGVSVPQWRPFLAISRERLAHYAQENNLRWIDDESNRDIRYARNFLRQEIIPQLQSRWPAVKETLSATALRLQEADDLLQELAAEMAAQGVDEKQRLLLPHLQSLSASRQRLLLRYWLQQQGFLLPDETLLEKVFTEVIAAREDATPLLTWSGCEIRRYREHLYAMPPLPEIPAAWECRWNGARPLQLPDGQWLHAEFEVHIPMQEFLVRYRRGGERFRPAGQTQSRELKTLLQEAGIPPWQRERLPLIFAGEELIAVPGLELPTAEPQVKFVLKTSC